MQIHEITKKHLQEGLLGDIGRGMVSGVTGVDIPQSRSAIDKNSATFAKKLQAQGYGQPKPLPSVRDSVATVQKNPAQQQYIKGLVSQWQQSAPQAPVAQPTATTTPAQAKIKTATTPQRSAQPSITIGGKLLTKGGDGLWHGETGAAVTDPAQAAKIDRAYQDQEYRKKQFRQTAIVREALATTSNGYRDAFIKWAGEKLRTVDPDTGQTITLDRVNKTDVKDELDRALAQVVATAEDPAKNTVAVNNYLTIAVAGIARESQRLKSKNAKTSGDAPTGQAIVTQQEIRDKLAKAGLNPKQLEQLKQLAQDPAARQALLKSFGVQA
jgi:hypothetical protein